MSHPTVTIVTPSLNQARFIERTILSVLEQDYEPIEYVVRDGGSTDGTAAILKRYADRVRVVVEPDAGQADAIDRGLREARGDVVAWLNSDDVYEPGAVATAVEYLRTHPECALVYGDASYIDADGQRIGRYPTGAPTGLSAGCVVCQPAAFMRRDAVAAVGFLDTRLQFCMDYDLWLRLRARRPVAHLPVLLAGSRLHAGAKSAASRLAFMREVVQMTHARLGRAPLFYLYAYANLLVCERLGGEEPPRALRRAASLATAGALALRYHRRLSLRELRDALAFERGPWPDLADLVS